MQFLTPSEINSKREEFYIVDIRENYEFEYSNIGTVHIPMAEMCHHIQELPTDKIIVLMCRSGKRASALCNLLTVDYDLKNIVVMEGGIEAWRDQIEPTLIIE